MKRTQGTDIRVRGNCLNGMREQTRKRIGVKQDDRVVGKQQSEKGRR
jgi:hypothetical protein